VYHSHHSGIHTAYRNLNLVTCSLPLFTTSTRLSI